MRKIVFIFALVILLALYFIIRINTISTCGTKDFPPVKDEIIKDSLNIEEKAGQQLFYTNCLACHPLTGNIDPPLLQNKIKNYHLETFSKFVRNEERLRENTFNAECIPFPNLNDDEIRNIFKYLIKVIN